MNQHPLIGENILRHIPELKEVILGIKYHHERYDGTGYPEGLKGEQIPLIAAIISLSDSYDAMITDRPYRKALSKEEAISEILSLEGKQFHPKVTSAFLKLYREGLI
ncbi:MAG: HD domain-containing protein [Candidatus Omnitrophica bacterium]|nr:HD domain-containing protein [Candidatus Omnitrophota bacterium]